MKTLRYRIGNEVKPGILDSDENIYDASSLVSDWDNENVTIEKLNEIKSMDISSYVQIPTDPRLITRCKVFKNKVFE